MVTPILFSIGGDGEQGLRRGLEQGVIDHRLIGVGDVGDGCGQREHDMEVAGRQQIGAARVQPRERRGALAFGAVAIAAGIVGDVGMRALFAAPEVSSERCRAASRDRRHDTQLSEAQMTGTGMAVSGSGGAEDIRDFQC